MTTLSRSETALIRPFASIDAADAPLDQVQLLVDGEEFAPGAVVLPDVQVVTGRLSLVLPTPEAVRAAVEQTPVPWQDCGLVVLMTARSNRVSRVQLQAYLKQDAWPEVLHLHRDAFDLVLGDRAGYTITVAVVLLHDLAPAPLRPHMAGTWLARREFSLSPEREDTSFSPEELTDEIRKHFALPEGVMSYIRVGDWQTAEVLSDEVSVYVDPEVLNLLLGSPTESVAVQLQVELAIRSMETVAITIAREMSDGSQSPPTIQALEPFAAGLRFFESLSRVTDISIEDLLDYATRETSRVRTALEAAFKVRDVTTRALKEK